MSQTLTDVQRLVSALGLVPHPEGRWYRELHRSHVTVQAPQGPRSALTTIHYLLAAGQFSRWHVVESDEMWHLYQGEPLELLTYDPATRELVRHVLSASDATAQVAVVPAGVWQAARPRGAFALAGCTVGPGFAFEDFRFVSALPGHQDHLAGAFGPYADLL